MRIVLDRRRLGRRRPGPQAVGEDKGAVEDFLIAGVELIAGQRLELAISGLEIRRDERRGGFIELGARVRRLDILQLPDLFGGEARQHGLAGDQRAPRDRQIEFLLGRGLERMQNAGKHRQARDGRAIIELHDGLGELRPKDARHRPRSRTG